MQTTKNILLIRPANFKFNAQTENSNAFQNKMEDDGTVAKVKAEFDNFAKTLKNAGVNPFIFDDTVLPIKPDAIFPNNWVTFHADGTVVLYPMHAENRQFERRLDIIEKLEKRFTISKKIDLSKYEEQGKYLEGTGSIIFDHKNRIAYACISPRTDKDLFIELCDILKYQPISFCSYDESGKEIYHTNVMMCIGEKFATICLASILIPEERAMITNSLTNTGHQIIDISLEQMKDFAGNMLEIRSTEGNHLLALSETAFKSLTIAQKDEIEKYCQLLPLDITNIETIGGGSARCMIAEIFLPEK